MSTKTGNYVMLVVPFDVKKEVQARAQKVAKVVNADGGLAFRTLRHADVEKEAARILCDEDTFIVRRNGRSCLVRIPTENEDVFKWMLIKLSDTADFMSLRDVYGRSTIDWLRQITKELDNLF
jgi:hypothetical protein